MSTTVPVPEHCLEYSFVRSKFYELDMNFDEIELKSKSYHTFDYKVKLFHGYIVVIEI